LEQKEPLPTKLKQRGQPGFELRARENSARSRDALVPADDLLDCRVVAIGKSRPVNETTERVSELEAVNEALARDVNEEAQRGRTKPAP
jgi:hypothetical protein